jgi:selenide,water dikinase
LPGFEDKNRLVGWENMDDAGVYALDNNLAIVQSIDVITPVSDDPYIFGQIVAANSLSDIYAMGAKPITAMVFLSFPVEKIEKEIIGKILKGLADKVKEAEAVILGGHTLKDTEVKCGLAVTGICDRNKVITNSNARIGDKLILTKPLGIGIITTAIKADLVPEETISEAHYYMCQLNKTAMEKMLSVGVNSATDITGFGLLGHALEMAKASRVDFHIYCHKVPMIEGAIPLAKEGLFPNGSVKNFLYLKEKVYFSSGVSQEWQMLLCDAQTSGGLLIAVSDSKAERLLKGLKEAGLRASAIIGEVAGEGGGVKVLP